MVGIQLELLTGPLDPNGLGAMLFAVPTTPLGG